MNTPGSHNTNAMSGFARHVLITSIMLFSLIFILWLGRIASLAASDDTTLAVLGPEHGIAVSFTGIRLNRTSNTFDTQATITHQGTVPVSAPLQLVFTGLPSGVSLVNASGTDTNGDPYVEIPLPLGKLEPGNTLSPVLFKFNNPGRVSITFVPVLRGRLLSANRPPVANAGPDQTVDAGRVVTLDGGYSQDVDGDSLIYQWTLLSKPAGSSAELFDPTSVRPSFVVDLEGVYEAQLIVNDGSVDSAPDSVVLTVIPGNTKPVANAGPDQAVEVGQTVTLDGSGSYDVDGDNLTYQWTLLSKPAGSSTELSDPAAIRPSFIVDLDGSYVAQLIVNDGWEDSKADTVILTVLPGNTKPVANAGPDQTVDVGKMVTLNGSGSHDVDGNNLTYSWTLLSKPEGSLAELSDPTTVQPTFTVDLEGIYVAQLIVNDGKADSNPDNIILTVVPGNTKPVANAGPDQTATVGETIILDGLASYDANNDPLTYRWALTTVPEGSQAELSDFTTEQTSFIPDLAGMYVAQLIVNDGISDSTPDTVVITINLGNSRPVADAGADQAAVINMIVTLNGTGSFDADNDPLTYRWDLIAIPEGSNVQLADPTLVQTTFTPDMAGIYVAQLIVSDGMLESLPDTVLITAQIVAPPPVNQPPKILSTPVTTASVGVAYQYTLEATDPNGDALTFSLTTAPDGMSLSAAGELGWTPNETQVGDHPVSIRVVDPHGEADNQSFQIRVSTGAGGGGTLPPDPVTVAPMVDPTVATTTYAATSFLYTGANPLQTGVQEGTIEPKRVAVLRGRVLDKQNNPLSGVTITVHQHPEFGQTVSRADGQFDMAVNGGGLLTLNYRKEGYLLAQRQLQVPWQDFAHAPEVVLIPLDSQVTVIDLRRNDIFQAAQGNSATDQDGTRRPALLIPPGTTATRYLPDGSTVPLETLSLRFSEYTVGENGPQTMPGPLPANVAYTYALEISADEAPVKLNGKDVLFNQAVSFYVDNFLNFPVGGAVPMGYYDSHRAAWIPSENGRVIKILSISNGMANLDVTGSGAASDAATLAELGITDAERQRLAALYEEGKSLWRVPITHLSTWDCNWPFGPPLDAKAPSIDLPSEPDPKEDKPCLASGSIIECENQTLGQSLSLVGTNLSLNYRSDRTPGRLSARTLRIPLSDDSVPASLKRIEATVQVAGRSFDLGNFPAMPNQITSFSWDGLDSYGRELLGSQPAIVTISYVYDGEYQNTARDMIAFGRSTGFSITGSRTRQEIFLTRNYSTHIGGIDLSQHGVAGWSLDVHHFYDPLGKVLYQGDGSRRSARNNSMDIIKKIAGVRGGFLQEDIPAVSTSIAYPTDVVAGPDGSLYIADLGYHRIRRIGLDGIITTIAGNGDSTTSGDGGSALSAGIPNPRSLALGQDGSIYISTPGRIRRISQDGIITTVAGGGTGGDGSLATQAQLSSNTYGIAIDKDGSLYITENNSNGRIRRVSPAGIITTVAGSGSSSSDGIPAATARLVYPSDVALGPDGSLYITEDDRKVRRVGMDGIITTVAGTDQIGFSGDGQLATLAQLQYPKSIAVSPDGSLYIADSGNFRIRRVGANGIITTIAGNGSYTSAGKEGIATDVPMQLFFGGLNLAPDDTLFFTGAQTSGPSEGRVWQIRNVLELDLGISYIASEDGSQFYRFDAYGRHLSTLDTITGATLFSFGYNDGGHLTSITDVDGNVIVIERDGNGNPLAIVAPFGQRTTFNLNNEGYLARVTNPAGEVHQLNYTPAGLLTGFTTPNGHTAQYSYDNLGRLVQATDALGANQALARTELANGHRANRTTALGRNTGYQVENLSTGERKRTIRTQDNTETVSMIGTNGLTKVTSADGTISENQMGPDPRFGMQAPVTTASTVKSGGLTLNQSHAVSAELSDPNNPLSLSKLTRTTTINDRNATSVYTAATRRTETTTPASRQSYALFDSKGRTIENGVAGLEPVKMNYDNRGRLATVLQGADGSGRMTTFAYNDAGYLASSTDALGQSGSLTYDDAGRVLTQTLSNSQIIRFAYDANGNLASLSPPGRPVHTFTYNALNLATAYHPPAVTGSGATSTLYEYNADKQIARITRPDGGELSYGYDSAGRLATLSIPAGQYGYTYHATTGQLVGIAAPGSVSIDYSYNGGLLTSTAWSGPIAGSVGYGYDNDFRVNQITVNGADPVAYQYDADSLLIQAGDLTLSRSAQNGLLAGTALGNATESYTYNGFVELNQYAGRYGDTDLIAVNYTRDVLGRIVQKTETIQGISSTYEYAYDLIGQLIEVRKDGIVQTTWGYDANGNRTHVNGTEIARYDAQDRLLEYAFATYDYTANGELSSKSQGANTTRYDYDALGNLRKVIMPSGTVINYLIDGANRRIGKQINGSLVQGFLYQGQLQPVAELDGNGSIVSRFVYATGINVPDYLIKGGQTYRILKDHLGSPRLVVNIATGDIAQRMDYDTFGRVILDTHPGFQPFGFAGGLYDRDTSLVRFGARDYDPETGRWTAKDPLMFYSGNDNFYKYSSNSPVNLFDLDGLSERLVQLQEMYKREQDINKKLRQKYVERMKYYNKKFGNSLIDMFAYNITLGLLDNRIPNISRIDQITSQVGINPFAKAWKRLFENLTFERNSSAQMFKNLISESDESLKNLLEGIDKYSLYSNTDNSNGNVCKIPRNAFLDPGNIDPSLFSEYPSYFRAF